MKCSPLSEKRRLHGLLSIMLLDSANLVALVVLFLTSVTQGLVFLVCYLLGIVVIVFSYCSKCPCRQHACAHVVPGAIAAYLPKRRPGRYTGGDLLGVALPVTILLIFPQAALLSFGWTFYLYWILVVLGVADILLFVCPGCGNENCLLKGRR